MSDISEVVRVLRGKRGTFRSVVPFDLGKTGPLVFDFSERNRELGGIDLDDPVKFTAYVFGELRRRGVPVGVGCYDEDRVVYRGRALFGGGGEHRSVHLGIDIFVESGTPVSTPLAAEIHSFANNETHGDYGPTIILEHRSEGVVFFTLYGHLSVDSLAGLRAGGRYAAGEVIGRVGGSHENGGWAPHLHFQVITDMGTWRGDFPGTAAPSERERYLGLCPDPNLILGIPNMPSATRGRLPLDPHFVEPGGLENIRT